MKKLLIPILAIFTTLCASAARPNIKTPNIDRMAKEGRKFTSFMVASPVCTPSRAALLTGSYPKRVGMHKHVLFPASDYGLNPEEYTLADHFRSLGYATAAIGKWHLGLAENTYVIFTGDNGPWLPFKNHGGSALPLRDGKGTTFEGGQRVTCVMWAPGRIPAGTTSDALISTIALLPTLVARMKELDVEITENARPVWRKK